MMRRQYDNTIRLRRNMNRLYTYLRSSGPSGIFGGEPPLPFHAPLLTIPRKPLTARPPIFSTPAPPIFLETIPVQNYRPSEFGSTSYRLNHQKTRTCPRRKVPRATVCGQPSLGWSPRPQQHRPQPTLSGARPGFLWRHGWISSASLPFSLDCFVFGGRCPSGFYPPG